MPSKFGGIPVDGGSKFGGVPVSEQPGGVRPSLFRNDSDFRKRAGVGVGDMLWASAKDMFGTRDGAAEYLAKEAGGRVAKDADGSPVVELPDGTRYRMNDAGADSTDVANVAGNVAAFFTPASWASRAAQARNLGTVGRMGLQAGAAGATDIGLQAVANGGQVDMGRTGVVAAGGAGGELLGAGLRGAASRAGSGVNVLRQKAIETAKANNIPLHISQISQSVPVKTVASAAKYLPLSGAGKAAERQQGAFNRAVGKTFGADADVLTDDAVRSARLARSTEFEDVYSRNDIPLTPDALTKLAGVVNTTSRRLTKDEAQIVGNQFDDIMREMDETGTLTGQKYQALRSQIKKAEGPDKTGQAVAALRKALDDIAADAVGPQDAATLKRLRGQWANLRTTEGLLKQVEGAKGNVKPAALWPAIRNGSTQEMRELAKLGQVILKDPIPDSGTMGRAVAYSGLGGAGLGSGGTALPGLLGLLLGGATAGRALNSPLAARLLLGAQAEAPSVARGLARVAPASGALVVSQKKRRDERNDRK